MTKNTKQDLTSGAHIVHSLLCDSRGGDLWYFYHWKKGDIPAKKGAL
jgi:hypothetical protein